MDFDPRNSRQLELHEWLQAEVLHTLGAYGLATQRLRRLRDGREDRHSRVSPWDKMLGQVVDSALSTNEDLRLLPLTPSHLRSDDVSPLLDTDESAPRPRQPYPGEEQISIRGRHWIVDFYASAVTALTAAEDLTADRPGLRDVQTLGLRLRTVHDPQRRARTDSGSEIVRGRIARNSDRRDRAAQAFRLEGSGRRSAAILHDHLGSDEPHGLHLHVLEAFSQAHLSMHRAEHHLTHSYGIKIANQRRISRAAEEELQNSIILNTFVYAVGRSVPWIFAENDEERAYVVRRYSDCCELLTPTYCMWMARQISLLALHRRAFAHWLLQEPDLAYRDFYKLTRFLRGLRPPVQERAARAPGAMTFIDGLTAISEHHTGRIYRSQHAHKVALRHFDRAYRRLEPWRDHEEIGPILRNSRWRIHLLLSQGKANYELGRMTDCLLSYLRGWRAYLDLAGTESRARANFAVVDGAIAWLETIREDPEIDKVRLRNRIEPLVKQFETVLSPAHLRIMAADIMMRLGHVLFILCLPRPRIDGTTTGADHPEPPLSPPDHSLALRCLRQAAQLDRSSTLITGDLLKMAHRMTGGADDCNAYPPNDPGELQPMPLAEQWPAGGGRFEESARVTEFVLHSWLNNSEVPEGLEPSEREERLVARDLLAAFLAHTDSSNVKLAQVYRYLMQEARAPLPCDRPPAEVPTIDFVCVRRYSSFFPFLPRPSAFRAPGGGYFVQVQDPEPFGIAIDPGPSYLDNLYRCGYCLDDIHMVIVTHDHADHLASLDALLALMGTRIEYLGEPFGPEKRLIIAGNASVVERYRFFNAVGRRDFVRVMSIEALHDLTRERDDARVQAIAQLPPDKDERPGGVHLTADTLTITPVRTFDHRDAGLHPAQGFTLSVGDDETRSSILFTSDTGPLEHQGAKPRNPSAGDQTFHEAARDANVVIAHASSIPLPEVRRLGGLSVAPPGQETLTKAYNKLWESAKKEALAPDDDYAKRARFLMRQLQFGFRTLPADGHSLNVSPLSPLGGSNVKPPSEKHLYLAGTLALARELGSSAEHHQLLVVGELREELGTFRTRIATAINTNVFGERGRERTKHNAHALTADIGLRIRIQGGETHVLCSTCDLDNDLVTSERFHASSQIREVCVKGEDEGIFYNCSTHNPGTRRDPVWLQAVERYDPFGD